MSEPGPTRFVTKTTWVPSADHAAKLSSPLLWLSWTGTPPAAGTAQMSLPGPGPNVNAIFVPSGDQSLSEAPGDGTFVSCVAGSPFAGMIQIWRIPPLRREVNAICVPSGDQVGPDPPW